MLYNDAFLDRLAGELRAALPQWGLSALSSLRLLTISENATWLAEEAGTRLVLRVHRPGYHSPAEIRSELAWIAALRAAAIVATPRPIPTRTGDLLTLLAGGLLVAAFAHMSGQEPDTSQDLPKWFAALGEITARLHQHSRSWAPAPDFTRKRWDFATILGPRAHWGDWRRAPGLDVPALAMLTRAEVRLAEQTRGYGEAPDRFGLIHCDMRAANLLVDGDRLGVIDFDDCGFSWFAYDFAASVSFMEHEPFLPALMAAWLQGYRRIAPLGAEHEQALPMFVMLRRMQLTAWIASHGETPTAQAMGAAYIAGTVTLAERYLTA